MQGLESLVGQLGNVVVAHVELHQTGQGFEDVSKVADDVEAELLSRQRKVRSKS